LPLPDDDDDDDDDEDLDIDIDIDLRRFVRNSFFSLFFEPRMALPLFYRIIW